MPQVADFEACKPPLRRAFVDRPTTATMIECGLIDPRYRIKIEGAALLPE
ncbi:RidA family protein [Roseobacter weihaiensis]|nr:hypothetical protein [Roseobacter sp. H9]